MLSFKNYLLFYCLLTAATGTYAQQSYNNYVGNGSAGNSNYGSYIYTGGLSRDQVQFIQMLSRYKYPMQEVSASGGVTEVCLGPIYNGGEAELILNDMRSSGFSGAYLGSSPSAKKEQGSQVNVSDKHAGSTGEWPPYSTASYTNSAGGVDKTGMTIYTPQIQPGKSENNSNSGAGYYQPNDASGVTFKGSHNGGNSSIQFIPPPQHDFQEDRLNDALSKVGLDLYAQLPETQKVLNQKIEEAAPANPRSINDNDDYKAKEPLTTFDKGALLPVFFVQVAALNTSAEATQYENLSSDYTVYLQQENNLYKVLVGPLYSQADAAAQSKILNKKGFTGAFQKNAAYYQREPQIILTKDGKATAGIEVIYPQK
ncbi:SPOR domain-containing protein [Sphingobacteriales bacterium UPWRP_1]|nr:hypothetical protein BVG80_14380 [Sphingobacteriales bacterium TSM_CSM]PSJ76586.1 SPOR domain-containing protein [Sphingobacteriales bacterium UPWRP_1]